MQRVNQTRRIETLLPGRVHRPLVKLGIQLRCATQNPQIFAPGLADHCIPIFGIQPNHPVVAVKRPKERYFQLGVGLPSDAFGDALR